MEDQKKIAYKAMFKFLDEYYKRGKSDDIGALLGSLSLLNDGKSADPSMMDDWDEAYVEALKGSDDDYLLKFID
jgi:hypothetical protein